MTRRTDVPYAYIHVIEDLERAAARQPNSLTGKLMATAALFMIELADEKYDPERIGSKPRRPTRVPRPVKGLTEGATPSDCDPEMRRAGGADNTGPALAKRRKALRRG